LTFIIYLNMTPHTGPDRKVQGLPKKNTTRGMCAGGRGGWRFFFEQAQRTLAAFYSARP
jgi:hypothetical protein